MSSGHAAVEDRIADQRAAHLGVPSLIWRDGQQRRLQFILESIGERRTRFLDNGCGIGLYVQRLEQDVEQVIGLEYDHGQALEAIQVSDSILRAAGEQLPFPDDSFDGMLSHEVIEHVQDDQLAISEMVRVLQPGGRLVLFCPNRGYPVETHGVYWRGKYIFGNIPLVNWLPRSIRDRLAPHVRVYSSRDLKRLFRNLPIHVVRRTIIFGAYDNIIHRRPRLGRLLRRLLQTLEKTPLRILGLSHFWVVEKSGKQ